MRGYQVVRVLSQQPDRRVYLATTADGSRVVLKELSFSLVPDAQTLEAFQREAQLLRQLSHPRLPTFLEAFEDGSGVGLRLYLAMSYVEGDSLLALLESHRFNEAEVLDIAAQALQLLVYLHGLSPPVIHRDVKPANLLRKPDGTLALVDFGAAREVRRGATGQATLVGTLGYMPPEQMLGVANTGSDVYALGATLIHLLSREPPSSLLGAELRLEFRERVNVRPATLRFLERLVDPRPNKRFATAVQALAELGRVRSGRASRWSRGTWVRVGMGLGVTAALAAGGFVLQSKLPRRFSRQLEQSRASTPVSRANPNDPQLNIACPEGTEKVERLAAEGSYSDTSSRWCQKMDTYGQPLRHGPLVRWDAEGKLLERAVYVEDRLHGPQVVFNRGERTSAGERREGRKHGVWRNYHTFQPDRLKEEETWKDDVLEGPWRSFSSEGQLEQEGTYHDGKKQGVWKRFHRGNRVNESTYEQDVQQGPYTAWYFPENSTGVSAQGVKEQGAYAAQRKTGPWVEFHDNGQKKSEGSYEADKKQGAWSTWFANGTLASQGAYVNDEKTGPWVEFHDTGQKKSEGAYGPQGKPQGEWRTWHPNGQLSSQGAYADGKQTGLWVRWHANGQKQSESRIESGKEIGTMTAWHENGKKALQVVYSMDDRRYVTTWFANGQMSSRGLKEGLNQVGPWTTWHENGKKQSLTHYDRGSQHGLVTKWHDNGRKEAEGEYSHGIPKSDTWRYWNPEGEEIKR